VVAVRDANSALAKEVAARLPCVTVYAAGEELIASKEVDAVVVTSWGDTHRGNRRAGGVADPLFMLMDMRSGALVTIETSVNIA
jgi:hypothetical protein